MADLNLLNQTAKTSGYVVSGDQEALSRLMFGQVSPLGALLGGLPNNTGRDPFPPTNKGNLSDVWAGRSVIR